MVLEGLKDFLRIFTWIEFWMATGIAFVAVGCWVLVCFALMIPNDAVRSLVIWGFIFLLSVLGGVRERSLKKAASR